MVGPWISWLPPALATLIEVRDVGDIEYLATQQFNGNVTRLEGDISAITNTLTHTVTAGKDGYILVAKIIPSGFVAPAVRTGLSTGSATATNQTEAKISANAVELDRVTVGYATSISSTVNSGSSEGGTGGCGSGSVSPSEFKAAIGMKATTGQVIEIENTLDNGNCRAQLVILEVDTGVSPALLAQAITVDAQISGEATDLAFIQAKVIAGDYFQVSDAIDNITDTIEFIVPNGKTAFLLEAKIVITTHPAASLGVTSSSSNQEMVRADLKIDTVTKDTTNIGESTAAGGGTGSLGGSGSGYGTIGDGRFNVKGLSLVGDGVKKIEIENTLDNGSADAVMSGYLVDT